MIALDRASETAAHWSEERYQDLFRAGSEAVQALVLVAEDPPDKHSEPGPQSERSLYKNILGFLVARHLAPEWELENIVVAPAACRRALGRQFIEWLLNEARRAQSESVFLEVRESNTAARALYEATGFQQVGRRKSYYSAPSEDAIVYRSNLRPVTSD
jgi:ribosomal-protein-alanine N-acetyltransferase